MGRKERGMKGRKGKRKEKMEWDGEKGGEERRMSRGNWKGLTELWFYVPLDTKYVISETFSKPISWLGERERRKWEERKRK